MWVIICYIFLTVELGYSWGRSYYPQWYENYDTSCCFYYYPGPLYYNPSYVRPSPRLAQFYPQSNYYDNRITTNPYRRRISTPWLSLQHRTQYPVYSYPYFRPLYFPITPMEPSRRPTMIMPKLPLPPVFTPMQTTKLPIISDTTTGTPLITSTSRPQRLPAITKSTKEWDDFTQATIFSGTTESILTTERSTKEWAGRISTSRYEDPTEGGSGFFDIDDDNE